VEFISFRRFSLVGCFIAIEGSAAADQKTIPHQRQRGDGDNDRHSIGGDNPDSAGINTSKRGAFSADRANVIALLLPRRGIE